MPNDERKGTSGISDFFRKRIRRGGREQSRREGECISRDSKPGGPRLQWRTSQLLHFMSGLPSCGSFVIRDGYGRYRKDLSSRGKAMDTAQEIADELARVHRMGDAGMRSGCKNVYETAR